MYHREHPLADAEGGPALDVQAQGHGEAPFRVGYDQAHSMSPVSVVSVCGAHDCGAAESGLTDGSDGGLGETLQPSCTVNPSAPCAPSRDRAPRFCPALRLDLR
ncbi:hypothetical protein GCM10010145_03020 [Streptomyces ruber]|uniref:Uncharacterized protein n=2 Tax=Streptomyces TaxID=1883 RepID=A0A918B8R9_9ACTN|nr:hypothetical protein GCM10010145_03020 [Streptomyces ruber]